VVVVTAEDGTGDAMAVVMDGESTAGRKIQIPNSKKLPNFKSQVPMV
jgi:hypothetical protein